MSEHREQPEGPHRFCEECKQQWTRGEYEYHSGGCQNIPKDETCRVKRPSVDDPIVDAFMEKVCPGCGHGQTPAGVPEHWRYCPEVSRLIEEDYACFVRCRDCGAVGNPLEHFTGCADVIKDEDKVPVARRLAREAMARIVERVPKSSDGRDLSDEPEKPTPQKRPCAAYGLVHVIDTGGDVFVGRSDTKDYWVLTDEEYEDLEACVLDILDQRNPRIEFACVDMGRVGRDLLDSFKPGEVVHDE